MKKCRRQAVVQEQQDPDADVDAVQGRGRTVGQEPDPLAERVRGVLELLDAPDIVLDEVVEIIAGPLGEVGDLDQVREHIVGIEPKQRVAVEQQRRDAGDEDDVVGDDVDRAGGGLCPDDRGDRGHGQFRQDPGHAHDGPVPLVAEGPGTGGIDVGQGKQHQEHHAHGVHLAGAAIEPAEPLAGEGMAELMADLDDHEAQVQRTPDCPGPAHRHSGPTSSLKLPTTKYRPVPTSISHRSNPTQL